MSGLMDPWREASQIATLLAAEKSLLVILIGAEQWCSRCHKLRPVFQDLSLTRPANEVWLWLDVEDHAEFLGDYFPEDLPLLLMYVGSEFVASQVVAADRASLCKAIEAGRTAQPRTGLPQLEIRQRLLKTDWA